MPRESEEAADALELELQTVVRCSVHPGNGTRYFAKQEVLLATEHL